MRRKWGWVMNKYRIEYDEEQKIEKLLLYRKKEKR